LNTNAQVHDIQFEKKARGHHTQTRMDMTAQ